MPPFIDSEMILFFFCFLLQELIVISLDERQDDWDINKEQDDPEDAGLEVAGCQESL